MKLLFASLNVNKIKEIRYLMPDGYHLLTLSDFHFNKELEETATSIEGNALQKARFAYEKFKVNCFSDDSGLEVESLGGKPGINSAFYAGTPRDDNANVTKLLAELQNFQNRNAVFRTTIALIIGGKEYLFEGRLYGEITERRRGKNGFGYDPVFLPKGFQKTLAEMEMDEKNRISHRGMAVTKLMEFLRKADNNSH